MSKDANKIRLFREEIERTLIEIKRICMNEESDVQRYNRLYTAISSIKHDVSKLEKRVANLEVHKASVALVDRVENRLHAALQNIGHRLIVIEDKQNVLHQALRVIDDRLTVLEDKQSVPKDDILDDDDDGYGS